MFLLHQPIGSKSLIGAAAILGSLEEQELRLVPRLRGKNYVNALESRRMLPDKPEFGIIVEVSLLAAATMRLRMEREGNWLRASQILSPRSIYALAGEARTEREHSIPPLDALRYAITFRTLSDKCRPKKGER